MQVAYHHPSGSVSHVYTRYICCLGWNSTRPITFTRTRSLCWCNMDAMSRDYEICLTLLNRQVIWRKCSEKYPSCVFVIMIGDQHLTGFLIWAIQKHPVWTVPKKNSSRLPTWSLTAKTRCLKWWERRKTIRVPIGICYLFRGEAVQLGDGFFGTPTARWHRWAPWLVSRPLKMRNHHISRRQFRDLVAVKKGWLLGKVFF